jgi:hypothetical protein
MAVAISPGTGRAYVLRASVMALGLLAHRFTLGGGNNSVPIRHRYRHAEVPGRGSRTPRC